MATPALATRNCTIPVKATVPVIYVPNAAVPMATYPGINVPNMDPIFCLPVIVQREREPRKVSPYSQAKVQKNPP